MPNGQSKIGNLGGTALKIRLVITGSSGYLAQQLIARLGSDPDVEFILGLDIRPRQTQVACASEFLVYDLTRPASELQDLFRDRHLSTGLHLAWQFNPIHNTARHRQVDVEGSRHFFEAAAGAGLRRIVYTSSTTAYTDCHNSEGPLPEETPVTGTPRYLYSKHKAKVDRIAQEFARANPQMQVLILRPSIVIGPHTRNIASTMVEWPGRGFPWMAQVRGFNPPMQYLSEEDIAEILYRSVKSEVTGIVNCAGDGVVRVTELARLVGKKSLPLPAPLIYGLTGALWKLRLTPFPSGILDMIRYPWVADTTRMKRVFGYSPRFTSHQAVETFVAGRRAQRR
jgi:UDP-glucose 4-epimerase